MAESYNMHRDEAEVALMDESTARVLPKGFVPEGVEILIPQTGSWGHGKVIFMTRENFRLMEEMRVNPPAEVAKWSEWIEEKMNGQQG